MNQRPSLRATLLAVTAACGCAPKDFGVHLAPPALAERDALFDALRATPAPCVALVAKRYDPLRPAVYAYATRAARVAPALASAPADPATARCLGAMGEALFTQLDPPPTRYLLQLVVLDQADLAAASAPDPARLRVVAAVDFPPREGADVCLNSPRMARTNEDVLRAAVARCRELEALQPAQPPPCALTFDDLYCGGGTP